MLPIVFIIYQMKKHEKRTFILLASYLVSFFIGSLCVRWDGLHPILSSNKRSIYAFYDHYIWTHQSSVPTWASFESFYPNAKSIIGFIFNYPFDFFQHFWINTLRLPLELSSTLTPFHTNISIGFILILLLFVGIGLPRRNNIGQTSLIDYLFLGALVLPALVLNTALHPWGRYMVSLSYLTMTLTVLSGQFLSTKIPICLHFQRRKTIPSIMLIAFLVSFFSFQKPVSESSFSKISKEWRKIVIRKNEFILFTNYLPLFVSSNHLPYIYLAIGFPRDKFMQIGDWVQHEDISLLCHADLYDLPSYTGLTENYHSFLSKTEEYGFKPYYISDLMWCARKEIFPVGDKVRE